MTDITNIAQDLYVHMLKNPEQFRKPTPVKHVLNAYLDSLPKTGDLFSPSYSIWAKQVIGKQFANLVKTQRNAPPHAVVVKRCAASYGIGQVATYLVGVHGVLDLYETHQGITDLFA